MTHTKGTLVNISPFLQVLSKMRSRQKEKMIRSSGYMLYYGQCKTSSPCAFPAHKHKVILCVVKYACTVNFIRLFSNRELKQRRRRHRGQRLLKTEFINLYFTYESRSYLDLFSVLSIGLRISSN